jgi:gliding motility-associated-like protein
VLYCPNDVAGPLADSVIGTNLLWYSAASGGIGSSTSPTPSTSSAGSTNYYVSQSNGNCEGPKELIVVSVNNPLSITIGPDSTICEGNIVKYFPNVTPSGASYSWRAFGVPSSTIDSINNLNASFSPIDNAVYFLKATLGGCSTEKAVNVNVRWKPIVDAGKNIAICLDGSTTLAGVITHTTPGPTGFPISDFVWTPKDSLSFDSALVVTAYPTKTTWYKLTVKTDSLNYGCAFTSYDSVKVVVQPVVKAFAGKDTLAVKGAQHQLQGSGGTSYEWSSPTAIILNPALKNPFVVLNNDANFYLKVSDAIGCEGLDSVFVKVYNGPQYYVPNAFSPNGDGQNDIFRAIPVGISNTTYFRVFNRYGELLFETNQWLKGWDGTFKGKPQPSGSYVWSIKGTDKDRKVVELQGSVILIR